MSARTEKPTQAHLKRLRRRGLVPSARTLPGAVGLLVAVALGPLVVAALLNQTRRSVLLALAESTPPNLERLSRLATTELHDALLLMAMGLGVLATAVVVVAIAQTGGLVLSRRTGSSGEARDGLFGRDRRPFPLVVAALANVLLPLVAVWTFAGYIVVRHAPDSLAARGDLSALVRLMATQCHRLLWVAASLVVLLGLFELLAQWYVFRKNSRMTREELRLEVREQRGAPETIEARRRHRAELSQLPPLDVMPHCRLIIDDGAQWSVLVAYRAGVDRAPHKLAVACGLERQEVLDEAARAGIAIATEPRLTERLLSLAADRPLPLEVQLGLADAMAEAELRRVPVTPSVA